MNILLIRPRPPEETIGLQHVMIVEPLELEILGTLVQDEHDVRIVDLILEEESALHFIEEHQPDVVGVTGYITHTYQMIEVCRVAKQYNPRIATIVGGVHVEQVPERIDSPWVDYRVVRNAAVIFPGLIAHIAEGKAMPAGVLRAHEKAGEASLPAYDFSVPIPDRSLTAKYRSSYFYVFHNKVALLKTSYGCPFPCNFCFCRKIAGEHYHERGLDEVIRELKSIREKEVYIIDDNFLVSQERLRGFLSLLREHNIRKRYLIYGRADFIAAHPELIRDFRKLGLRTIIVGFESFNDAELDSLNKHSMAQTNERAMQVLNQNGVDCYASVIAMPQWDKDDFKRATQKMCQLKIRFVNIQPLTPLEKTDMVFDEGRLVIARSDYPKWDLAHITVQPEKMSVEAFYAQIIKMYRIILFRPSNLLHHLKYPIAMQWKLMAGAMRVKKQYMKKTRCPKSS